jgi:nucleoside-diphosphate-sugar epimerase
MARWRLFPVIGQGHHFVSSIHVDDAAAAVVAALGVPAGVYNVCDDEPLPMRDYVQELTSAFGFPRPLRVPPALVRFAMGPASEVFTRSQRVANTMFKAVSTWKPRYPSVRQGWPAVARALGRDPLNPPSPRKGRSSR